MTSQSDFVRAMTNRSVRTVRLELEFLADASVITPQQLSSILNQLPKENDRQASAPRQLPPAQQQLPPPQHQQQPQLPPVQPQPAIAPPPSQPSPAPYSPPTNQFANTSLNEKAAYQPSPPPQQHYPSPQGPPPAYPQGPPPLSIASALYAYTPTDPGDLALQPNDRVHVLEHMNADWWRGRNERTNLEGIFPRSYVNVVQEKGMAAPPPTNYGNMPLEVSQGGAPANPANPEEGKNGKFEEHGKKFGKKIGNAAIFGAGATMGSNLVNSIF